MNDEKIKEIYYEMEQLQASAKQLNEQHDNLNQKEMEIAYIKETLNDLENYKEGHELFVPINNGIFIKAKVTDTSFDIVVTYHSFIHSGLHTTHMCGLHATREKRGASPKLHSLTSFASFVLHDCGDHHRGYLTLFRGAHHPNIMRRGAYFPTWLAATRHLETTLTQPSNKRRFIFSFVGDEVSPFPSPIG